MRVYWPCAESRRKDGIGFDHLFTHNAADSLEAAMRQLSVWKYEYAYDLVKCWIDMYDDGVKLGTKEVEVDDIKDYSDYSGCYKHDCTYYFVSDWEQAPDSYTLEVIDGLWGRDYERVTGVPGCDVHRVEMELMRKWKDEMAKYGFSPAQAYRDEMEMEDE